MKETSQCKWKKRAIHTQVLEIDRFRDVSRQRCYLGKRMKTWLEEDKIKSKISNNLNS